MIAEDSSIAADRMAALRRRFMEAGDSLKGFSGRDAVELILGYSGQRTEAGQLAASLIERRMGLAGVMDAPADELAAETGLCEATAILLKLVKALASSYLKERLIGANPSARPALLREYLSSAISGERIEKFLAVFLNGSGEAIAVEVMHEGTINQTIVYPRSSVEAALRHKAAGLIFAHNHPSGDPAPSDQDLQLIKTLDRAAAAAGLAVHDHLVAGRGKVWSAAENGWRMGRPFIARK
ncbi:MAG: DNA repair protein RadC [Deltaproteobacteria bacterium]|nr:DNA repair protein RadC [Deltaproteobacteria bacterium]